MNEPTMHTLTLPRWKQMFFPSLFTPVKHTFLTETPFIRLSTPAPGTSEHPAVNAHVNTSPEAQHQDNTPDPRQDSTAAISRGPRTQGRPTSVHKQPDPLS